MKMLITGLAVAFAATAAFAQKPTTPPPAEPMVATPPAAEPTDTPPPPPPPAPQARLVQKDGVWWNGDRRATPAEIAEYQRNKPR